MLAKGWSDPVTVILINPNSTQSMTQSALTAARAAAPEVTFEGWTSTMGPPAIEGPEDGAKAVPPLLELVQKASDQGACAIIIACFDDTGLRQAQLLADCPVIGIGQASFVVASLLPGPTAVITTVHAAVPVIQANIQQLGFGAAVPTVIAADVPVLKLESTPRAAAQAFASAAQNLPAQTGAVILGCAGAVTIADDLRRMLDLRVLDGVTAAARLAHALTA